VGQENVKALLDTLNASSGDICASLLMTKDGMALVSTSPRGPQEPDYDPDRMSALSASILGLGHQFTADFLGGELDQILVKGKGGNMLTICHGQDLALTVLTKPDAEQGQVFSQMRRVAESLGEGGCNPLKKI